MLYIKYGGVVGLAAVLFANEGAAKAAVHKSLGYGNEDGDHADEAKLTWREQPGQDDTHHKMHRIGRHIVHGAPEHT